MNGKREQCVPWVGEQGARRAEPSEGGGEAPEAEVRQGVRKEKSAGVRPGGAGASALAPSAVTPHGRLRAAGERACQAHDCSLPPWLAAARQGGSAVSHARFPTVPSLG